MCTCTLTMPQNPTRIAQSLKRRYPDLYGPIALHQVRARQLWRYAQATKRQPPPYEHTSLQIQRTHCKRSPYFQMTRIIAALFSGADAPGGPGSRGGGGTSAQFGDLQRVGPAALAKAKMVMEQGFQANQVKPGDAEFEYDKRVDFVPEEDNAWDEDSTEDASPAVPAAPAPASGTAVAPAQDAPSSYTPSWMAAGGDDAASDGSDLSLGDAEDLPDGDGGSSDGSLDSDLDVDDIY